MEIAIHINNQFAGSLKEVTTAERLNNLLSLSKITRSLSDTMIAEPGSMNILLKHVCSLTKLVVNEKMALIMENPTDDDLFEALTGII